MKNFSLLMAVYAKDNPQHLREALISVLKNSILPTEYVIVQDGPITPEIESTITEFQEKLNIKRVEIEKNVGLGMALAKGIHACSYDWVARFDSDDICSEHRFEKQLMAISQNKDIDIISCYIEEFEHNSQTVKSLRKVPCTHQEILKYAKRRSPFNHMGVMYRKSKVLEAGNYQPDFLYEDYSLWVRMLHLGCTADNIPEPLVKARIGNGMLERRGGWKYAINELKSQNKFRVLGFLSTFEFLRNVIIRFPSRLAPISIRKFIYEKYLRK